MKVYCKPEIKDQFILSAKPIDNLFNLRVEYNGIRLIDIPYPTEIIRKSFDNIKKEIEIHDGDEHGVNLIVYKITNGIAKDYYVFNEYNHGSCPDCDYYSSTLCKLCYIPDHKINDAVNDCKVFINYIIRSIKLVEPALIHQFIIDNYSYRWENDDESPFIKLKNYFIT